MSNLTLDPRDVTKTKTAQPTATRPQPTSERQTRPTETTAEPKHDTDLRPTVQVTLELADVITQTGHALTNDPNIFVRNAQLVRVTKAVTQARPIDKATKKSRVVVGTPQVWPLSPASLCDVLTGVALFTKWDAKSRDWKRILPSQPLIQGLHARHSWPGMRELVGIIETPSMRPDGSVIDCHGYDAETGYLYAPNIDFPPVPTAPTRADAKKALEELSEVFFDFPFATVSARHVPIAALLTLIARPAIIGCVPAFVFDAPTPGTGKSLCADALCTIATGRTSPRGTFPADPSELEKILASHALQATAVIGFDNIATGFGGASLDKCLTAISDVDFRILGKTESPRLPWKAVILASGNNVSILGDTARRVLIGSLASDLEKPEDREGFKHPDLLPWIVSQRGRLVCAALTILRAYVVAGRPNLGLKQWGSFESFTKVVASAIVFAGGANVLEARSSTDNGDHGERGQILALLEGWPRLDASGVGLTTREAIRLLYPPDRHTFKAAPDEHDMLREAIEGLTDTPSGKTPDPHKLAAQLRRFKRRVFGKKRIDAKENRSGIMLWKVIQLT